MKRTAVYYHEGTDQLYLKVDGGLHAPISDERNYTMYLLGCMFIGYL